MIKKYKKPKVIFTIVIAIIIGVISLIYGTEDLSNTLTSSNISENTYEVIRVVDGDTLVINIDDVDEKVRLIGIDTPESVHPDKEKNTKEGKEISDFVKNLLTGKEVQLEFDAQERDRYGRILAYVYLDSVMINKELLSRGYANVYTVPPNIKYKDEFLKAEQNARESKSGFWNE